MVNAAGTHIYLSGAYMFKGHKAPSRDTRSIFHRLLHRSDEEGDRILFKFTLSVKRGVGYSMRCAHRYLCGLSIPFFTDGVSNQVPVSPTLGHIRALCCANVV